MILLSHQANAGVMSCAICGLVGLMSIYFMSLQRPDCY